MSTGRTNVQGISPHPSVITRSGQLIIAGMRYPYCIAPTASKNVRTYFRELEMYEMSQDLSLFPPLRRSTPTCPSVAPFILNLQGGGRGFFGAPRDRRAIDGHLELCLESVVNIGQTD